MSAEEKRIRQAHAIRSHRLKLFFGWALLIVLVGGTILYSRAHTDPNNPVIAEDGVHIHAHLAINVNGKGVPVPKGIGLIAGMEHPHQMHTHDADQIIHIELEGRVRVNDMRLKNFFGVWGQLFSKDNIMGNVAGGGKKVTMMVNGKENMDFEQYEIHDKDEIQIVYS